MKKLIVLAVLAFFATTAFSQANLFNAGVCHTAAAPNFNPGLKGCRLVLDTTSQTFYVWKIGTVWVALGRGVDEILGCSAPAYTPTKWQSSVVINKCTPNPELYYYFAGTWKLEGGAGGGVYTAGAGINISAGNVISNAGDLSNTNEIQNLSLAGQALSISGGTGVTLPIVGATAADFDLVSGVLSLDYTNAQKATALVPGFLTAADWAAFNAKLSTEVDGSVINELNTSLGVSGANLALVDAGGTLTVPVVNIAPVQSLISGTGINITGTSAKTINSTITQYTDENAQDAVGAMAGNTLTYTDATPLLDVKTQMSITSDASGLKLSGDAASPGNTQLYGTSGSGVKGWYAQPSGGGGTVTAFSSGNLSPLFTTSVATATTTPALSFALSTQTANTVFSGPVSGIAAAPNFRTLVAADIPAGFASLWTDGGATTYLTATTDNVAIGATSANSRLDITDNSLGVTQTNTSGIVLSNNTAAEAGLQKISPGFRWRAQGWKTTATAASQAVDFRAYVLPVQGTTSPTGSWILQGSVNGGAYTDYMTVRNNGTTGSIGMNVAPDVGYTLHLKSPAAGSNFYPFVTRSAASKLIFYVADDGIFSLGNQGTMSMFPTTDPLTQSPDLDGKSFAFMNNSVHSTSGQYHFGFFTAMPQTFTTGEGGLVRLRGRFAPSSGSATYVSASILPIYNQSGTASGNCVGIDYSPLITSITGNHYAALFRSGSVGIGASDPDRLFHVETSDAVTNAVTYPQRLTHITTGTATTGFGAGTEIELENGSGTNRVAMTEETTWTDAVSATEDATYSLNLIRAGTLTNALTVLSTGNVGVGQTTPTATLHIKAGTAAANTAPVKLTSGPLLTVTEPGAVGYNNSLYFTKNSGLRFGIGGIIFKSSATVPNVTTTETDLYSHTLPASALATENESVEAAFSVSTLGSATATTQNRLYFGGTLIYDSGAIGFSIASDFRYTVEIIRESATVVKVSVTGATTGATAAAYTVYTRITGLTLTNTQILRITGTRAGVGSASGDINGQMSAVKWFPAAG